jgi:uncharacterized protein involved in cysteine biosynthesis
VGGLQAASRGLSLATSNREVRRTYGWLMLAIFVLAVVLDIAGIWAVLHFTAGAGDAWWGTAARWLLRIAGVGIVMLAAPVLAMFVVNIVFPTLGEQVFYAGLRAIDPARANGLVASPGLPLRVAVTQNLIRMVLFVGLSIGTFSISFVPVVGTILGPVLQIYFTARALSWELLDPYFEKLELRFSAQHAFVRNHRAPLVGFALPYSFVMAIPLVGPFIFGLAQAAIAVVVADILERTPEQT